LRDWCRMHSTTTTYIEPGPVSRHWRASSFS
jgi:hypothetical protein